MSNASCGFTLQKNIIILSIIDLVCEAVGAALMCSLLVRVVHHAQRLTSSTQVLSEEDQSLYVAVQIAIASLSIHLCVYLIQIALSILLLIGAFQSNRLKCRIWLHATGAILAIAVISMILNSVFGSDSGNPLNAMFPQIFLFIYKGYMIWIVYTFINKLKFNNNPVNYDHEYDQVDLN